LGIDKNELNQQYDSYKYLTVFPDKAAKISHEK
jgi:hypothetical protein